MENYKRKKKELLVLMDKKFIIMSRVDVSKI